MPSISLGMSTNNRKSNWTPRVRCVNMLVEQSQNNAFSGVDHFQRPGLVAFADVGTGPVRGMFRQAGTLDGDLIVATGEELWRVDGDGIGTLIDDLPGTDLTTFAATTTRVIVVSDGIAYSTDGTTVTAIVMPDGRLVGSVAQLNGYITLSELDSARFYWIEPGQTDPDGLSFATTESSPGDILRVIRVGDELWFLKEEGSETWVPTGDADLPFQRVPGRNYDKGCRNRDAVCRFDNAFAFVGNDAIVYRGDAGPIRISDNTVEEKIRKADPASLRSWSFVTDGHALLCITMDIGTVVFDALSGQWSDFYSWERPAFRGHLGENMDSFVVAGDDELGLIYRLDQEVNTDDGEPMERIVPGIVPVAGPAQTVDNVDVYVTTGTTESPTANPQLAIRWSDDLRNYVSPRFITLGHQGRYGKPVRLNRLGKMTYPGRLYEFSVTDDVKVTISGASFNVPLR